MAGEANGERHRVRFLGTTGTVDLDRATGAARLRRGDGTVGSLDPPDGEPDRRTWAPARRFADLVARAGRRPRTGALTSGAGQRPGRRSRTSARSDLAKRSSASRSARVTGRSYVAEA